MKFNTILLVTLFFIIAAKGIIGQTPDKWFIKNGEYITGYSGSSYSRTSVLGSTTKFFDINGVRHPALIDLSTPHIKYGNDIFIIFDNGTYYNSRYINPQPLYANGDPTKYGYNIQLSPPGNSYPYFSNIKYLYFTDKYEDDDPPSNSLIPPSNSIKFSFPILGSNNPNNLESINITGYNQNSNILSANHDIVKGREITIIVPIINCNNPKLTYDGNILNYEPIQIQTNASIFNVDNGLNSYLNFSTPISPFQFANFRCIDPLPFEYNIGDSIKFNLTCNNSPQPFSTLSEAISSSHDPNFIKVQCIFRKRPHWFCPYKYYVVYHIECYNDGSTNESSVKLNFTLPNIIKPNVKLINWKFSELSGCGSSTTAFPLNPTLSQVTSNPRDQTVSFSNCGGSLDFQSPSTMIDNYHIAWVEICAELNVHSLAEVHAADLYISAPTTTFGSTTYPIMKFIDPITLAHPSIYYRRPISETCNCTCNINPASSSSSSTNN